MEQLLQTRGRKAFTFFSGVEEGFYKREKKI
jgi:hypothetical protein